MKSGTDVKEYAYCTMVPGVYLNEYTQAPRNQPNFLLAPKLTYAQERDRDSYEQSGNIKKKVASIRNVLKSNSSTSFPYTLANFLNQCEGHISYNSIPVFSMNLCKMLSKNME